MLAYCLNANICPPQQSVAVPLVSGAFAATAAWVVGYPFDIIKTRVQALDSAAGASSDRRGPSMMSACRSLMQEAKGDYRVFYRGISLKLLRAVPMNALGFFVYEEVKKGLELNWPAYP